MKPFPDSLCHQCGAPPRYIQTKKGSVFIWCPRIVGHYPPQPVRQCSFFVADACSSKQSESGDQRQD